jgi:hypothetical protein
MIRTYRRRETRRWRLKETCQTVAVQRLPLIGLFAESLGMKIVSGPFMCIEPSFGFMIWNEEAKFPRNVIIPESFDWSKYTGPMYPEDETMLHVMGWMDNSGDITAFRIWTNDQEMQP